MKRRELSQLLLASSATSALAFRSVQAQTYTAPSYPTSAAESAAGVAPTNNTYPPGDVRRYGADPTGSSDSTTALQSALNVAQAVYIPSGQYTITAPLRNNISKRRIYGDGPSLSVLRPTGAIDTLVNTAQLSSVLVDNVGILGDATTLDGITQSAGTTVLESRFENLDIQVGGRAFYLPWEFNTQL
ncbi:MAG TPA: glycosyl hydrolase family 28-related protein, partial [Steroidobacteraceae bacterium]